MAFSRGSDDAEEGWGYILLVLLFESILGIGASLILMWYSRGREYRADAGSARLLGRDRMVHALEHLKRLSEAPIEASERGSMAMFQIAGGRSMLGLFRSHPDMEERIARLRDMIG